MRITSTLTVVCSFIWMMGFGQTFADSLTVEHQLIGGTNIYLVPPTAFEPSSNFKGFQNPNDPTSMIMVTEIPGPYREVVKGFDTLMMKARGMDLTSKATVAINDLEGTIIQLDQFASGLAFSKHILVYGNDSATVLINGVFVKDSVLLGEAIQRSLYSLVIDRELAVDPRGALGFSVDETVGGLLFHSVIGNNMLFNRDLKTPTESADKATLIVGQSFAEMEIMDRSQFCVARLDQYPDGYELMDGKPLVEIEIDGLAGIELFARNTENTTEELYQVVLFGADGGYYLLVGTFLAGNEQAMTDIQNVIRTFRRK